MNQLILRSATLLALLAGGASAQIATPPPPAPPPTPEYVPPPPPPPVQNRVRPANTVPKPPVLPDLPFESLAAVDAQSGKLKPLTGSAGRLALERNPMIDAATRERVNAALAHRDARLDQIVIDNLDIVEKIDGGAMEQISGEDIKLVIKELNALASPLKPPGGDPSIELSKQGVLTREQASFSQKIIFDYNKALTEQRKREHPAIPPADVKANPDLAAEQQKRNVLFTIERTREGVSETVWRYPALLAEASKSLDKTLPSLGLPAETNAKLEAAAKSLSADATDAERAKVMKAALQGLTIDQRRDLLRKTVALRPPLPPVPEAPVRTEPDNN